MITTDADHRRWQLAAIDVLSTITTNADGLPPLHWQVFSTRAKLIGEPDGAPAERLAVLRQWAAYLDLELEVQTSSRGVAYHGYTDRLSANRKDVSIELYTSLPSDD